MQAKDVGLCMGMDKDAPLDATTDPFGTMK